MNPRFDPYDPEFLDDPYPVFDRLREETPVFRRPGSHNGRPAWFLTRYADVRQALRDRRLGRIYQQAVDREEWGLPPLRPGLEAFYEVEYWSVVWLEPPDHTRIRGLVIKAFTPGRVAGLRPRILHHADRLLDAVLERGRMDAVNDYAAPLSVRVIAELLGAPTADWRLMLDWSNRITRMYELNTTAAQTLSAVEACAEFREYCLELMRRRRADPQDDLITALCFARAGDDALTDPQIVSMIITLLNAGHEATVNTLANGLLALMRHPEQWRLLVEEKVGARTAVEELFRWDAPIQTFDRWVLAEDGYEAGGRAAGPIRAGDGDARLRQPRPPLFRGPRRVPDRAGRPHPRQLRGRYPPLPGRPPRPPGDGGRPVPPGRPMPPPGTGRRAGAPAPLRPARLRLPRADRVVSRTATHL